MTKPCTMKFKDNLQQKLRKRKKSYTAFVYVRIIYKKHRKSFKLNGERKELLVRTSEQAA